MNFLPESYNQGMEIMKVISANIMRERGEESRAALAKRAGVTYQAVYDIEEGNRRLSIEVLEKIARALNREPADLLKRDMPEQKALSFKAVLGMYSQIPEKYVKDLAELGEKSPAWKAIEEVIELERAANPRGEQG